MKRILILIYLIAAHLSPLRTAQIALPMHPALTHHEGIGNRHLSPPNPPIWMTFFPWPSHLPINADIEAGRQNHKSLMMRIEAQKQRLLQRGIIMANLLPDEHLQHVVENQGQQNCLLGECAIWIEIGQNQ